MAKSAMRTMDAKGWPTKGQTADVGAGSRAKAALAGLDDKGKGKAKAAYAKVVTAVKGLTDDEARAACFAAVADFTWEALIEKSVTGRAAGPKLGARDKERIEFLRQTEGAEAAEAFERMLLVSKAGTKGATKAKK